MKIHRTLRDLLVVLLAVYASFVFVGVLLWLEVPLQLVLFWAPWPILAAIAQRQRGGSIIIGLLAGLLAGPLGLLVANYSGGRKKA